MEFNDNRQLAVANKKEVTGSILLLGAMLSRSTESGVFKFQPSFRSSRYASENSINSDDQFAKASYQHEFWRSLFSTEIGYARESTLTSELDTTGLIQINKRRAKQDFAVSLSHEVSDKTLVSGSASVSEVRYENTGSSGLVDYGYRYYSFSLVRELSSIDRLTGSAFTSKLDAKNASSVTYNSGIKLAYTRDLSVKTQLDLSIGRRRTDYERSFNAGAISFSEREYGIIMDVKLSHAFQKGHGEVAISRQVDPSGIGVLQQQNIFRIDVKINVTPSFVSYVGLVYRSIDRLNVNNGDEITSRDYFRVSVGASKSLGQRWSFGANYQHQWQKYEGAASSAESNAVFINLSFKG